MAANKDHGFWPYLAPMFIFLGLVELGGRAPEAAAGVFLTLKVVVPLGLVVWFLFWVTLTLAGLGVMRSGGTRLRDLTRRAQDEALG